MGEYEVGYGKPPQSGRFRPGASGNPRGRPRRKASPFAEQVNAMLNALISYQSGGKSKVTTRRELILTLLVDKAIGGDLQAARTALKIRVRAERYPDTDVDPIFVENWMPDYPGQTAEQKEAVVAAERGATLSGGRQTFGD